jgi:hypothetical protein
MIQLKIFKYLLIISCVQGLGLSQNTKLTTKPRDNFTNTNYAYWELGSDQGKLVTVKKKFVAN